MIITDLIEGVTSNSEEDIEQGPITTQEKDHKIYSIPAHKIDGDDDDDDDDDDGDDDVDDDDVGEVDDDDDLTWHRPQSVRPLTGLQCTSHCSSPPLSAPVP